MGLDELTICIRKTMIPDTWLGNETIIPLKFEQINEGIPLEKCEFRCRRQIEEDFNYKQIIPYVLIFNHEGKVLTYQRHGTEKRVHDLWSAGVGGHVSIEDNDGSLLKTLTKGMLRECNEELNAICSNFHFLGIINEEKTSVGHAHIGLVFSALLPLGKIPGSKEIGNFRFVTLDLLQTMQTELWTEMAIKLYRISSNTI